MKPGRSAGLVKSKPRPEPRGEWATRLEVVRQRLGYVDWRSFHRDLTDGDYQVSYAAMRKYHIRQEPSPSYLAAVCRQFEVSPAYLLLGEGEP